MIQPFIKLNILYFEFKCDNWFCFILSKVLNTGSPSQDIEELFVDFVLSYRLIYYIRYSKFLKCLVLDKEYTRGHQVRSHGHWGIVLWRLTEWSCVYYHHRLYSYYVHNILDTNKIQYHSNIHRCLVAFNILILSGLASGNTTQHNRKWTLWLTFHP